MNLNVIEMTDREEAQERYQRYRRLYELEGGEEIRQIALGYQHLARGQRVIALTPTIIAGGLNEFGLPRLAACRSNARWCFLTRGWQTRATSFLADDPYTRTPRDTLEVDWPEDELPAEGRGRQIGAHRRIASMVPIVPAPLRPHEDAAGRHRTRPLSLANFVTLWEAEWKEGVAPPAPRDPALLRPIGGDLYAVLAVWDLTELERAVLSGRRP